MNNQVQLNNEATYPVFLVGDKVKKVGGNYQATGYIVGAFSTRAGRRRYVFEFEDFPGMLHIFHGGQLESINV